MLIFLRSFSVRFVFFFAWVNIVYLYVHRTYIYTTEGKKSGTNGMNGWKIIRITFSLLCFRLSYIRVHLFENRIFFMFRLRFSSANVAWKYKINLKSTALISLYHFCVCAIAGTCMCFVSMSDLLNVKVAKISIPDCVVYKLCSIKVPGRSKKSYES